ncbi:MAG: 50S ribosomal protein L25, partial [Candidatus Omnitrophota bacterium]
MEKVTVKGFRREKTGKQATKRLRREKFLPAIIYGRDINLPIKIPQSELKLL